MTGREASPSGGGTAMAPPCFRGAPRPPARLEAYPARESTRTPS